jgi:hypothetical protein
MPLIKISKCACIWKLERSISSHCILSIAGVEDDVAEDNNDFAATRIIAIVHYGFINAITI